MGWSLGHEAGSTPSVDLALGELPHFLWLPKKLETERFPKAFPKKRSYRTRSLGLVLGRRICLAGGLLGGAKHIRVVVVNVCPVWFLLL